jgi:hypothetical protein
VHPLDRISRLPGQPRHPVQVADVQEVVIIHASDRAAHLGALVFQTHFTCLLAKQLHEAERDIGGRASRTALNPGERELAAAED